MLNLLEKTEAFVTDLLTNELDTNYLYHNLKHTQRVVKSTKELLNAHELSEEEKEILLLATWLHDTGYTKGSDEHEKNSCIIAKTFLTSIGYDPVLQEKVTHLIMATKRHHEPKNLAEEIIRDADSSHFAQKSYLETSEFLREELSLLGIKEYSNKDWCDANITMFNKEHQFYTDYAKENWQEKKEKNLKKIVK